ncbi:hypothetical protein ABZS29_32575 [Kribbella sp. NPDC005582]|uniref:hypothetical protein n=1 Tax=Kribbella sp. NPDC005582 TaxID=3156893 RepID=UPI0033BEA1B4
MDQIDAFVNRIPGWLDETGAMAEPDLGLLRDLLTCRAAVLGHTDPWIWPDESLANTVLEVAPYVVTIDEDWRAAAAVTLPVLREIIVFEGDRESAASVRDDVGSVLKILDGPLAPHLDVPYRWSTLMRMTHRRKAVADAKAWQATFDAAPWDEKDRLVGPLRRHAVSTGGDPYSGTTVPAPTTLLPSVLAAAAGEAPLALAVVELAQWLVAQPPIAAGGSLDDDTVAKALAGTTLADATAVQEAWRIAALSELVGSTGARVVPGPQFAAWQDPGRRLECWHAMADAVVVDVPDPDRDEVMAAIYAAYHPGRSAEPIAGDLARTAIDRLRRLGAFDDTGTRLSPLGVQGLLFHWLNWDTPGRWSLTAGEWRPDLTTADVRAWLAASLNRKISDGTWQTWMKTADPMAFAHQLVDALLTSDDGAERMTLFALLAQLGSQVTPAVDRLSGTRLHAYLTMWPGAAAGGEPNQKQLLLLLRDQLAWHESMSAELDKLQPGVQIDLGRFDFDGLFRERIGRPGPLTEAELTALRETLATQRAEMVALIAQVSAE